jgi:hypothetical protein
MAPLRAPVQPELQELQFQREQVKRWQKEPELAAPAPDEL